MTASLPDQPFLTARQIARWMDPSGEVVTPRSIKRQHERGLLPAVKVGREMQFAREDVLAWIKRIKEKPSWRGTENHRGSGGPEAASGKSTTTTAAVQGSKARGRESLERRKPPSRDSSASRDSAAPVVPMRRE